MNKDRQHIEYDIETRNSISYEHNKRIFNFINRHGFQ